MNGGILSLKQDSAAHGRQTVRLLRTLADGGRFLLSSTLLPLVVFWGLLAFVFLTAVGSILLSVAYAGSIPATSVTRAFIPAIHVSSTLLVVGVIGHGAWVTIHNRRHAETTALERLDGDDRGPGQS